MSYFNNQKYAIDTAVDIANRQYKSYNKGNSKSAEYTVSDGGSAFTAKTDEYRLVMENGRMTYFEAYDDNGEITDVIFNIENEDGSIDYYYDRENNGSVDMHSHYVYDDSGNVIQNFTDENNNKNYELKKYTSYNDNTRTSEIRVYDYNDDGKINNFVTTTYYDDGETPKKDVSDFYVDDKVITTSTTEYDENGRQVVSKHDSHYNDTMIDRLFHPFKAQTEDYTTYKEYTEDGKIIESTDYNNNGIIDEVKEW